MLPVMMLFFKFSQNCANLKLIYPSFEKKLNSGKFIQYNTHVKVLNPVR